MNYKETIVITLMFIAIWGGVPLVVRLLFSLIL